MITHHKQHNGWIAAKRLVFLGLVVVAVFAITIWRLMDDTKEADPEFPTTEKPLEIEVPEDVDDIAKLPVEPETQDDEAPAVSDDTLDAETESKLYQVLEDYQQLPDGHVSRVDAWTNLEFLKQHSDTVRAAIDQLLRSEDEHDRLLGAFLYLELYGDTAELLDQAKQDPSVHVRAEVAAWLYEQGRFDEFERLLHDISGLLTESDRTEMRAFMNNNPPVLNVPPGLAALRIGHAMPLFYRELARQDPNTRSELLNIIATADMRTHQLSRYLEMLAFLRPDEQRQVLEASLDQAEHLRLGKYPLIRQLAALSPETDPLHVRLVEKSLPTPPDRRELAPVRYLNSYIEQLEEAEQAMRKTEDDETGQRLLVPGKLVAYREALLMLPGHTPSAEALSIIRAISFPYMDREQRRLVADILYIHRIESGKWEQP